MSSTVNLMTQPKLRRMNASWCNPYDLDSKSNRDLRLLRDYILKNGRSPAFRIMRRAILAGYPGDLAAHNYAEWREHWVFFH